MDIKTRDNAPVLVIMMVGVAIVALSHIYGFAGILNQLLESSEVANCSVRLAEDGTGTVLYDLMKQLDLKYRSVEIGQASMTLAQKRNSCNVNVILVNKSHRLPWDWTWRPADFYVVRIRHDIFRSFYSPWKVWPKYTTFAVEHPEGTALYSVCHFCPNGRNVLVPIAGTFFPDSTRHLHGNVLVVQNAIRGVVNYLSDALDFRVFSCPYTPCYSDIGIHHTIMHQKKSTVVYTSPYLFGRIAFAVSRPKADFSWKAVVRPFTPTAWLYLFSLFVLAYVTILGFDKATSSSSGSPMQRYIIPPLFYQGIRFPTHPVIRCFLTFWCCFCLVISTAFTSKLTSFIIIPEHLLVGSLEELPGQGYRWGTPYHLQTGRHFLNFSGTSTYQKVVDLLEHEDSVDRCLQRALEERFACIHQEDILRNTALLHFTNPDGMGQHIQQYSELPPFMMTLSMPRGSPLFGSMSQVVARYISGHFYHQFARRNTEEAKLKGRRRAQLNGTVNEEVRATKPINMGQLEGPFVALVTGMGLSTVVFLTEILRCCPQIRR